MPLYREENFLVIHAGSQSTLFLFGLQDSLTPPQYKVPTVVYFDKSANEYRSSNHSGTLEPVYPIRGTRIVDTNAFNALLKFILQTIIKDHPVLTINQVPLLLIVPSVSYSSNALEEVTRYVFEKLEFTAFNILDASIAATYGLGATSAAVVVNIGHESTQIVPVLAGNIIKHASCRIQAGGHTIDTELKKLLPSFTPEQITALKTSHIYEVLVDSAESFYSLSDILNENTEESEENKFDVARMITEQDSGESAPVTEQKDNHELQYNSINFNGQKITVGKERFQGTSKLVLQISEGISRALNQVPDLGKRQECYDNVIVIGGTSNIAGLRESIVHKLNSEYVYKVPRKKNKDHNGVNSAIASYQQTDEGESTEFKGALQVPSSAKAVKFPDYFPEWKQTKEHKGYWSDVHFLGGEIYSKQIFGGNSNHGGDSFLDAEIYEERGPQAIWDVSL